jgi:hypothetical protein
MQGMVGTGKVEVDPKVYNAARIIKCYGTLSCKGMNTDERPWRWSRLTVVPEKIEVASRELPETLAALAPDKNTKRDIGQKRKGPWTVENTQTYLAWTQWDCGDQLSGGKTGETAKWLGPCIEDENHKDAALILHDDGWWSFTCFHPQCEMSHKIFMAHWEELQGEKYPFPGKRADSGDMTAGWDIADVEGGTGPTIAPAAAGKQAEPRRFNLTDAGNGERLTYRWGNVFRYCTHRGWFYWTGKRWLLDEVEKIHKAALETVRRIPDELPLHLQGIDGDGEDAEKRRDKIMSDVLGWAKASEGKGHLSATAELCHSIGKNINVRINAFDQDLWVFNCDNGTLDLRTNEFRPHNQDDLITNISPVAYDPKADCPLWLEFLDTVMAGDQELIGFLQLAAGYSFNW